MTVVISAAGVLSPIGNTTAEFHQELFTGTTGVGWLKRPDFPADFPIHYFAALRPFSAPEASVLTSPYIKATLNLLAQIAPAISPEIGIDAIVSAHRDAGDLNFGGLCLRAGRHEPEFDEVLVKDRPLALAASFLKQFKGISVPESRRVWISNACTSANDSLAYAFQRIREGIWQRALILSLELEVSPLQMTSLHLLGALAEGTDAPSTVSRPFDKRRKGFVKGEGAAVFLLESEKAAHSRGIKPLARIVGFGASTDGYRLTEGRPDAKGIMHAMGRALVDAGLSAGQVDCISAHATSTPIGDVLEAKGIEEVFGDYAKQLPVTALKSITGHATAACGALETLAAAGMLSAQRIYPIQNLDDPDPLVRLALVRGAPLPKTMNFIMINSLGFGGQNCSLLLGKAE